LLITSLQTGEQTSSQTQTGGLRSEDVCTPEVLLGVIALLDLNLSEIVVVLFIHLFWPKKKLTVPFPDCI
jgi:hypothetical protein